jgi:two-component system chemotaxis response regulator CheY
MTLKENWPTWQGRPQDPRNRHRSRDGRRGAQTGLFRTADGRRPAPILRKNLSRTRATAGNSSTRARHNLRFEELNLLGPWPFNGMFDVIFCRNVVIYFDAPTRMALWRRFAERLHPGGTLFVGHSERVDADLEPLLEPSGVTQYRRTTRPVVRCRTGPAQHDRPHQQRADQEMSLKNSLQIMVVDDMSVSRGLIENALDEIGLRRVDFKTDGQSALRSLVGNPVHLVISDYNMPGMDGLGLLEALRRNKSTQRIGFILITGRADREVLTRGQQLGMNNFLTKPFSTKGLKTCIEQVVGVLH